MSYKKAPSVNTVKKNALERAQEERRNNQWDELLEPYKKEHIPYIILGIRQFMKEQKKNGRKGFIILDVTPEDVKRLSKAAIKVYKAKMEAEKIKKNTQEVEQPKTKQDV